jgi:hypothetical protein
LVKTRRILDTSVAGAKGHVLTPKGASLSAAQKAAADSIRHYLGQEFPDLAAVNKEYSYWAKLDDVMSDTELRKSHTTHGIGPIEATAAVAGGGIGAGIGMLTGGGPEGAALGSVLGTAGEAALNRLVRSTMFRTLTATQLDRLSNLLAKGDAEPILRYVGELTDAVATGRTPAPPSGSISAPPKQ